MTESSELFRRVRAVLSLRQVSYYTKINGGRGISYEKWRMIEAGEWLPTSDDIDIVCELQGAPSREELKEAAKRDWQHRIEEQYDDTPQEVPV